VRQGEGLRVVRERVNQEARALGAGGAEVTLEEILWGYACVRSRAFVLSESRFVQVCVELSRTHWSYQSKAVRCYNTVSLPIVELLASEFCVRSTRKSQHDLRSFPQNHRPKWFNI
jgi:hypothetical protein